MTRLIAGVAGGRRLVTPRGAATRPTADRTREALFSSIESLCGGLAGASFLDLYAGSGAVGLEAASRGADRVLLVERDPTAIRAIRANLDALRLPGVELRTDPVERLLDDVPGSPYDVVFLDPPYADPIATALHRIVTGGWLVRDGLVAVERGTRDAPLNWPEGITALRSKAYGEATLWYGRRS
ncbi:MAG: 16S rRNA (guanine(966)-N(2))-methyltransferase RsmD [Frankiaceae bacterium]|nr:16S rRNA (guanine(966)-N(2))-methyltransferase RsmD [Frankiaceae bacterium]